MLHNPSLDPISATTSLSGFKSTPNLTLYHSETACRNSYSPSLNEYPWLSGLATSSIKVSITTFGGGMSGSPILRDITSKFSIFFCLIIFSNSASRYGGRALTFSEKSNISQQTPSKAYKSFKNFFSRPFYEDNIVTIFNHELTS